MVGQITQNTALANDNVHHSSVILALLWASAQSDRHRPVISARWYNDQDRRIGRRRRRCPAAGGISVEEL